MVRLAFHDVFGQGLTSNGCIDFSEPANNGLQTIVSQLTASWLPFSAKISRADFWVLAATLAIQFSSTPAAVGSGPLPASPGTLTLPFLVGRLDAATCNDVGLLPGAGFSWAQSAAFFGRVGLSVTNIVALFGAHALGRAEFQNSGFDGGWTTTQSSFSNAYYAQMLGIPWANLNASANSNLWLNGGSAPATIRLRSDAEVAITPASVACPRFGGPGRAVSTVGCPFNSITQGALGSFAASTAAWYAAFAPAWATMVGAGATLTTPTVVTASPTASRGTPPSPAPTRGSSPATASSASPTAHPAMGPAGADSVQATSSISAPTAIIAGSAAGGFALVALVVAAVVFARRRAASSPTNSVPTAPASDAVAVPVATAVQPSQQLPAGAVVLDGIPLPVAGRPALVYDVHLQRYV